MAVSMQFEFTTTLVGNLLTSNVSLVDKSTNIMKVGSVNEISTGRGKLAQKKDTTTGDQMINVVPLFKTLTTLYQIHT